MTRAASLVLMFTLGCGARTGLEDEAAPLPDGAVMECERSEDCDDGIECTVEQCVRGRCVREANAALCGNETACLRATCDLNEGCQMSTVSCDDGVECTVDRCDPEGGCEFVPDRNRCPISQRCDPTVGCVASALIHDTTTLFDVDLPSGTVTPITPTNPSLTDIALAPDRTLFAVDFTAIYRLDETNGSVSLVSEEQPDLVALEVGPDGRLYAAALGPEVFRVDVGTGATQVVAGLPRGLVASGDIAFVGDRMLITVTDTPRSETIPDGLVEVDLFTSTGRLLGSTGVPCIWGLAAFGPELFGFSCTGLLLRIDPMTGASEVLADLGLRIGGAAAR
ncbi:MAG: hypothetical protein AAGF12_33095 [Myxococcota bacterium]